MIGKLTEDSYEYVIRFNLYEDKKDCELEEIFDIPTPQEFKVPKEWLDKVVVPSYGKGGQQSAGPFGGWINRNPNHQSLATRSESQETDSDGIPSMESLWADSEVLSNQRDYWEQYYRPTESDDHITPNGKQIRKIFNTTIRQFEDHIFDEKLGNWVLYNNGNSTSSKTAKAIGDDSGVTYVAGPLDSSENQSSLFDNEPDPVGAPFGGEYEYYANLYGVQVADAKDAVDIELSDLANCDEALVDIIRQSYELLGDKGRADLATNGF